jgi:hypothetical protein
MEEDTTKQVRRDLAVKAILWAGGPAYGVRIVLVCAGTTFRMGAPPFVEAYFADVKGGRHGACQQFPLFAAQVLCLSA